MTRQRPEYALLPAEWVDRDTRWRAYVAVRTACHWLAMPEPEIVWYLPSEHVPYKAVRVAPSITDDEGSPTEAYGWTSSNELGRIYLRADRPATFMETALHECRHLWQYRQPESEFPTKARRQADARAWAAKAMTYGIPDQLRF